MSTSYKLDDFDRRILELLQADARMSVPALAERVGLSSPACYRRIRNLRDTGAIEREVAVVSARTMGWPLTMIVLVSLERERTHVVDQFVRKISQIPEIIDIAYVTGDHDFVLRVVASDMESYDTLLRRMLQDDNDIRSFKTLVVIRQPKTMGAIPMRNDG
jgi:Lrp/AsnC family transcriptional regulator, leucine-responsive regulatory protein